ncbi:hypothetical protein CFP56_027375 [Quercus suber]|uniref:Uncharacterized protein n=1 Tax=Quercus suber TaxID=58331 RepID=A0AAW0LXZ8_QUESU
MALKKYKMHMVVANVV